MNMSDSLEQNVNILFNISAAHLVIQSQMGHALAQVQTESTVSSM